MTIIIIMNASVNVIRYATFVALIKDLIKQNIISETAIPLCHLLLATTKQTSNELGLTFSFITKIC